ncbi:hypothetical protein [Halomonas sp. E14]|uniref:hypothetical protein n=1 Tax=Halomonas sp. E14 TaxID=3397245 RepID=UPI00403EAC36
MSITSISHHGGGAEVTGSCHHQQIAEHRVLLVDCGLFLGQDAERVDSLEQHTVRFLVDDVLALVIIHVHLDRLPYLLAAGYKGPNELEGLIHNARPAQGSAAGHCDAHAQVALKAGGWNGLQGQGMKDMRGV